MDVKPPDLAAGAPINRVSTVDAVVARIRELILNGDLAPGTELRETELSNAYGVGRHSIRAAIQALAHQGLVRHVPHHGAFVPKLTAAEVEDLYTLRAAIELEAARKLAARPEGTELAASVLQSVEDLDAATADMAWKDVVDLDLGVHIAIVNAVDSPRMSKTYAAIIDELRLCLARWPEDQRTNRDRADHRLIVEAINRRETEAAMRLLEEHLDQGSAEMQRVLADAPAATAGSESPTG